MILVSMAAVTLQQRSHLCIPRKGIARPQSLFPHSVSVNDLYIPRIGPHYWKIFVDNVVDFSEHGGGGGGPLCSPPPRDHRLLSQSSPSSHSSPSKSLSPAMNSFSPSRYVRLHCNEDTIYVFPEKELRGHSPNFHIFIYSQDWSTYFLQQIGRQIVEIYKSLLGKWTWKLGLSPRNSFSGNISFKF